jgi:hypothetical protein
LRAIGRKVESHYRCAQDIEWAIDSADARVWLLQSRPGNRLVGEGQRTGGTRSRQSARARHVGLRRPQVSGGDAQVRGVMFDVDGTLLLSDRTLGSYEVLPGAIETLTALKERSIPFVLLTNGSAYPPAEQAAKLRKIGLPVEDAQMITPSSVTAHVLSRRGTRRALVLGTRGVGHALVEAGIETVYSGEPRASEVDAVYVGWHPGLRHEGHRGGVPRHLGWRATLRGLRRARSSRRSRGARSVTPMPSWARSAGSRRHASSSRASPLCTRRGSSRDNSACRSATSASSATIRSSRS